MVHVVAQSPGSLFVLESRYLFISMAWAKKSFPRTVHTRSWASEKSLGGSLAHSTSNPIEQASLIKFATRNCPILSLFRALRPPRQSELLSSERLTIFILQALLELLVLKVCFNVHHCYFLLRQLLRSSLRLLWPTLGLFIMGQTRHLAALELKGTL